MIAVHQNLCVINQDTHVNDEGVSDVSELHPKE